MSSGPLFRKQSVHSSSSRDSDLSLVVALRTLYNWSHILTLPALVVSRQQILRLTDSFRTSCPSSGWNSTVLKKSPNCATLVMCTTSYRERAAAEHNLLDTRDSERRFRLLCTIWSLVVTSGLMARYSEILDKTSGGSDSMLGKACPTFSDVGGSNGDRLSMLIAFTTLSSVVFARFVVCVYRSVPMSSHWAGKKIGNCSAPAAKRGYQLLSAILILEWRYHRRCASQEQGRGCRGAVHRPGVGKKSN